MNTNNNASNNYTGQFDSENHQKTETPLIEKDSLSFLNLFYDTLFNPELTAEKIPPNCLTAGPRTLILTVDENLSVD